MFGNIETVGQLLEELENYDPEAKIRWAAQPSWPFEYSLGTVVEVTLADLDGEDIECLEEELEDPDTEEDRRQEIRDVIREANDNAETIVYIGEGQQERYLPGHAASELGWK